jgi:hypothetical protein
MKLFRDVREERRTCNLGCTHTVTVNAIVEVEESYSVMKDNYYGPTYVGRWPERWYADADGNMYFQEATWDGPSSVFVLESSTARPSEVFFIRRPYKRDAAMDTNGNYLDSEGNVL